MKIMPVTILSVLAGLMPYTVAQEKPNDDLWELSYPYQECIAYALQFAPATAEQVIIVRLLLKELETIGAQLSESLAEELSNASPDLPASKLPEQLENVSNRFFERQDEIVRELKESAIKNGISVELLAAQRWTEKGCPGLPPDTHGSKEGNQ